MGGVEYWQAQADMMLEQANQLRERAAGALDPGRNKELLALASYCEEAAANMADFTPSHGRGGIV